MTVRQHQLSPVVQSTVITVGIYARISDDRDNDEEGVQRQLGNLTKFAEERGWTPRVYVDNDISAKNRKRRPDYERMMADGEAGVLDKIVVFHQSRMWRNRRERADGIERLQRMRVSFVQMKGPELDMTHAYSRSLAALVGEFDTMESDIKSERVKAAADERAQRGEWHGGTLAFGLRRVGTTIEHHPVNAELLRDAARRALAGESLYAICRDWSQRGITTQRGSAWRSSVLRSALLTPSVIGVRVHEGTEYPVPWQPILDRDTWERLNVLLTKDSGRGFRAPISGGWEGKRALNGLVICGNPRPGSTEICGSKLVAQRDRELPRLLCREVGDTYSSIKYGVVESFVLDMLFARLDSPEFRHALATRPNNTTVQERALQDELVSLDARRRRIGDAVEIGAYTKADAAAKIREIALAEERIRNEQAALARSHVLDGVESAEDARALWESADVTRQRRFLASFITEIVVLPHPAGRCRSLPRRRDESDESLNARRAEHERETARLRIDIKWRQ